MRRILLIVLAAALPLVAANPPVLFSSDIIDGPRTGGENGKGAYVRVFGANFGATRGTSTILIGATPVDNYPCWGTKNDAPGLHDMACFQLGNVPLGAQGIQLVTANGRSNTIPFTVRPDPSADVIYCVATAANVTYPGSDTNNGHFLSASPSTPGQGCFATLAKATGSSASASAIVYDIDVGGNVNVTPNNSGASGAYSALLAYPGNTVTLDPTTGNAVNVQNGNHFWAIGDFIIKTEGGAAALQFHGGNTNTTITFNDHYRLVNNDISCPNIPATTQTGCLIASFATNLVLLNNNWHDNGCNVLNNPTGNQGHVNYFTTDVSYVEVGGSTYQNNCLRGEIHVHSSPLSIAGHGRVRLMRPVLGQSSGGSLGARTYYVRTTWQFIDTTNAETYGSYEISKAVSGNNFLTVHPYDSNPQCCPLINVFPTTASTTQIFSNIFVGSTPGSETFQTQLTCTVAARQPTCPTWTQAAEITTSGRAWPHNMSGDMDISGLDQLGIKIHDTLFSNFPSEGILFGNLDSNCKTDPADPDTSVIYNNVFAHGGKGPQNQGQHIAIGGGGTENGRAPCGTTLIQNNTGFDIGSAQSGAYGFMWPPPNNSLPDMTWQMDDNIIYQLTGEPYFCSGCPGYSGSLGQITGHNNDWFTSTVNVGAPAGTGMAGALNVDPLFVAATFPAGDFHLQSSSPAKNAGITTFPITDFDGLARPQGSAYDIGAFEIPSGITVTTLTLGNGVVGHAYSASLSASGGTPPYSWAVNSGSLTACTGLSLASNGTISGTPTAGPCTLVARATDSLGAIALSGSLTITISPAMSITTGATLPSGTQSVPYPTVTLVAAGGNPPYTWAKTAGAFPSGVTLDPALGTLSGTPTSSGVFTFSIAATDSTNTTTPASVTKAFSLTINSPAPPLSVTTTSLPNGVLGSAYAGTLAASGGTPPYTWSIFSGSLPGWGTLDSPSGNITGIPNAVGTTTFTVRVTDSAAATANKQLSIAVPNFLIATGSPLPVGSIGTPYNAPLTVSGGTPPYTWIILAGALPAGLVLFTSDPQNILWNLTGVPMAMGVFNLTLHALDSVGDSAGASFTLKITGASITRGLASKGSVTR